MVIEGMDIEDLRDRLQNIGVDVSETTLRRWGKWHWIEDHRRNVPGTGRGNTDKWSEKAYEEAAAIWAIFNRNRGRNGNNTHSKRGRVKQISTERIYKIKAAVDHVYKFPSAFYEFPQGIRITGPEPTSQWNWRILKMIIVPDPTLDAQVKTWIAAKEKAKRNMEITETKRVMFYWRSRLSPLKMVRIRGRNGQETLDIMKRLLPRVDREETVKSLSEKQPVSFPHDYTRMVRSPRNPAGWELRPARWVFDPEKIELEDAEHDDLVFFLDGCDSRIKAFYAPYEEYDPSVDYERRAGGLDQNGHIAKDAPRDGGIDTLIDEARSLINEISPLLAEIDRKRINMRIISSVLALVPTAQMHLIRWSA